MHKVEERKECKAIELRSGKEIPAPHHTKESAKPRNSDKDKEKGEGWVQVEEPISILEPAKYVPKLPYPERQKKMRMNKNFQNFQNTFRKLIINIPFAEVLEQIQSYAKFMK